MAEATMAETRVLVILRAMIMERQRLLIREANYLRGLVGLPPVRAGEKDQGTGATAEARVRE